MYCNIKTIPHTHKHNYVGKSVSHSSIKSNCGQRTGIYRVKEKARERQTSWPHNVAFRKCIYSRPYNISMWNVVSGARMGMVSNIKNDMHVIYTNLYGTEYVYMLYACFVFYKQRRRVAWNLCHRGEFNGLYVFCFLFCFVCASVLFYFAWRIEGSNQSIIRLCLLIAFAYTENEVEYNTHAHTANGIIFLTFDNYVQVYMLCRKYDVKSTYDDGESFVWNGDADAQIIK